MRPIRARRGGRPCARSPGSSTTGLVRACRRREREPSSAGRGARPCADRRRPGRPQPVRRLRAPRRRGGAVRRGGGRRDRALPARRPAAEARARKATTRSAMSRAHSARPPPRSRSRGSSISRRPSSRFRARGLRRRRAPRSAAAGLVLRDEDRAALAAVSAEPLRVDARDLAAAARAEVVLVMGIPGAGKTRVASEYVERGYARLNRDERGGSLRDLADALDESLAAGTPAVVLDNTYLTRASRSHVLDIAARHGASSRVRLARHPARAGAGQPRRAAARALRLPARSRGAAAALEDRAGRPRADVADARPAGARASVARRGIRAACGACPSSANGRREAPPACSSRAPRSEARAGTGRRACRRVGGADAAVRLEPRRPRARPRRRRRPPCRRSCAAPSRLRSARTVAARRSAGAGLRCPGSCSNSRARTTSTRPPRSWSARAPRTGRSPRRSARATSRPERRSPDSAMPSSCAPADTVRSGPGLAMGESTERGSHGLGEERADVG